MQASSNAEISGLQEDVKRRIQRTKMDPFFLSSVAGKIFVAYHPADAKQSFSDDVIIVPPFAEEMNKSRRMVSMLAARLNHLGYGVLVFDLFGTGDSAGDFSEARWDIWLQDLATVVQWSLSQGRERQHLLGIRMGALLVLNAAKILDNEFAKFIFWQPIISGKSMMNQFLRLRLAASMMDARQKKETTGMLLEHLHSGQSIEVAGYELSSELFLAVNKLYLDELGQQHAVPMYLFDLVADEGRSFSPATQKVLNNWQTQGVNVEACKVVGKPFWSLQETIVVTLLLDSTARLYGGLSQ